jgi:hypothetical protein
MDLVSYVLKVEKIDTIMHFAAQTHVGMSNMSDEVLPQVLPQVLPRGRRRVVLLCRGTQTHLQEPSSAGAWRRGGGWQLHVRYEIRIAHTRPALLSPSTTTHTYTHTHTHTLQLSLYLCASPLLRHYTSHTLWHTCHYVPNTQTTRSETRSHSRKTTFSAPTPYSRRPRLQVCLLYIVPCVYPAFLSLLHTCAQPTIYRLIQRPLDRDLPTIHSLVPPRPSRHGNGHMPLVPTLILGSFFMFSMAIGTTALPSLLLINVPPMRCSHVPHVHIFALLCPVSHSHISAPLYTPLRPSLLCRQSTVPSPQDIKRFIHVSTDEVYGEQTFLQVT